MSMIESRNFKGSGTSRRGFLAWSARMAAAGLVVRVTPAWAAPADSLTYGVQMFMVRAAAEKDLATAFKMIKTAGFDQVELYPIAYHQPAKQLRKLLDDTGLTSVSGHFDYTGRALSVDYAHGLGLRYLVCPMLPESQKTTPDGFRRAAEYFSEWGEQTKRAGMQFVFHNHDYEFKPLNDPDRGSAASGQDKTQTHGWTILMDGTDAALVKLEFDLFWLTTAGQDPAAMLQKYADRAVLVHLKDRVAGAPQSFVVDEKATSYCTELGKGTVDWPALLKQASAQGIRYAYLDQDETKLPVTESMKQSREYLRTLAI